MSDPRNPIRRLLPSRRNGFTLEATVAGEKFYLQTGQFEDGSLGEIFIRMDKADPKLQTAMQQFADYFSILLQYGARLDELVELYQKTPSSTGLIATKFSRISRYICQELELYYLGRFTRARIPEDQETSTGSTETSGDFSLAEELAMLFNDVPLCEKCGRITVRHGACFKCVDLDCGHITCPID